MANLPRILRFVEARTSLRTLQTRGRCACCRVRKANLMRLILFLDKAWQSTLTWLTKSIGWNRYGVFCRLAVNNSQAPQIMHIQSAGVRNETLWTGFDSEGSLRRTLTIWPLRRNRQRRWSKGDWHSMKEPGWRLELHFRTTPGWLALKKHFIHVQSSLNWNYSVKLPCTHWHS